MYIITEILLNYWKQSMFYVYSNLLRCMYVYGIKTFICRISDRNIHLNIRTFWDLLYFFLLLKAKLTGLNNIIWVIMETYSSCLCWKKKLTCQTECPAEAVARKDTCWYNKKRNQSRLFHPLWHTICFNKSLSIWPWFVSAHSGKLISPTSPLDFYVWLRRAPSASEAYVWVFYRVNSSRRLFGSEE